MLIPCQLLQTKTAGSALIAIKSRSKQYPRTATTVQNAEFTATDQRNLRRVRGTERFFRPGYNANLVSSCLRDPTRKRPPTEQPLRRNGG
jgi:hypothetical protein